jgi:hypothetical protein
MQCSAVVDPTRVPRRLPAPARLREKPRTMSRVDEGVQELGDHGAQAAEEVHVVRGLRARRVLAQVVAQRLEQHRQVGGAPLRARHRGDPSRSPMVTSVQRTHRLYERAQSLRRPTPPPNPNPRASSVARSLTRRQLAVTCPSRTRCCTPLPSSHLCGGAEFEQSAGPVVCELPGGMKRPHGTMVGDTDRGRTQASPPVGGDASWSCNVCWSCA